MFTIPTLTLLPIETVSVVHVCDASCKALDGGKSNFKKTILVNMDISKTILTKKMSPDVNLVNNRKTGIDKSKILDTLWNDSGTPPSQYLYLFGPNLN